MTRGLTNIIFVVALIAIGLGTALRIGDYQAKKALPMLIIIALLINFTPVILGFIIDASNIIMNFFVSGGFSGGGYFANFASQQGDFLKNLVGGGSAFYDVTGSQRAMSAAIGALMMIFSNIIAIAVYFVFSFLFVMRYVVLWLLVVLSPFAFACYILPTTRGYFGQWWKQFTQWCFIGVTAAFFLYLADHMIEAGYRGTIGSQMSVASAGTSGFGDLTPMINAMLPYGMSAALLILGFVASVSSSAMGAGWATGIAKKAGGGIGRQTAGRFLATKTGGKFMKRLESARFGLPETAGEWRQASWGRRVLGALTAPAAYPARWGLRAGAKYGLEYGAKQPQLIDAKVGEFEKKFGKDVDRAAGEYYNLGPADWQNKIALGLYLAQTKGAKGLGRLKEDQLIDVIKVTSRYHPAKLEDIVKHRPDLIENSEVGQMIKNTMVSDGVKKKETGEYEDKDVGELAKVYKEQIEKDLISDTELIRRATYKKAIDAMENKDLETADKGLINNKDFVEQAARWKSWSFIRKIGEEWGPDSTMKVQDAVKRIGIERLKEEGLSEEAAAKRDDAEWRGLKEVAKTNPTFVRGPTTPGGQMLFRPWKDERGNLMAYTREVREEINKIIMQGAETMKQAAPTPSRISQLRTDMKSVLRAERDLMVKIREAHKKGLKMEEGQAKANLKAQRESIKIAKARLKEEEKINKEKKKLGV